MKVKTLKPHGNGYGPDYSKSKDDEYDIPAAAAAPLIIHGFVEEVKTGDAKALSDMTVADLDKIIADEGVEVPSGANKAAKVEAIIASRMTSSGDAE